MTTKTKIYVAVGVAAILASYFGYKAWVGSKEKDEAAASESKDALKMTTGTTAIQRGIKALVTDDVKVNKTSAQVDTKVNQMKDKFK